MARYFGLSSDQPGQSSERKVANALRELDDTWTVLHHVSWQSIRRNREGDGEADFVLIHANVGILVIEVKGGGIEVSNGRWSSTDRYGQTHKIKNPYEQAVASKHALIGWLENRFPGLHVPVGHAVAFPNVATADIPQLGPAATPAITISSDALLNIGPAIDSCANHWKLRASLSGPDVREIVDQLAPTVNVRVKLGIRSQEADHQILQLTAEQVRAFAGIRAARGGLILGSAGSGKTILAIARAQKLVTDGFRTLLVCYNELLGAELEAKFGSESNSVAMTYHSLCMHEMRRASLPIPHEPDNLWWETGAPAMLIEACAKTNREFDAIVVDEAQDFSPSWIDSLRCLTRSDVDSPFFVFADPKQELWNRDWKKDGDWQFVYELHDNLRNTLPIATRVARSIQSGEPTRGASGPSPVWRDSHESKKRTRDALNALEQLIEEGFGPGRIVVLCESPAHVQKLRDTIVGPYSLGAWGSRGIPVETIARFKGLESEAVVLVLEREIAEQGRVLAYVGMSRARSMLLVVGPHQSRRLLNWDHVIEPTTLK